MNIGLWWIKPIPIGTDSWWTFAIILIALVVFVWLIARLVTRATEDSDPAEIDRQMLTTVNDLQRKGDLSQEEFRSIKGQLVDRLRQGPMSSAIGSSNKDDHADSSESTNEGDQDTVLDLTTCSDHSPAKDSTDSEKHLADT